MQSTSAVACFTTNICSERRYLVSFTRLEITLLEQVSIPEARNRPSFVGPETTRVTIAFIVGERVRVVSCGVDPRLSKAHDDDSLGDGSWSYRTRWAIVRPGLGMGTRWAEGIPKAWTHNKRMLAPRAITRSASRFGGHVLALAFIYK